MYGVLLSRESLDGASRPRNLKEHDYSSVNPHRKQDRGWRGQQLLTKIMVPAHQVSSPCVSEPAINYTARTELLSEAVSHHAAVSQGRCDSLVVLDSCCEITGCGLSVGAGLKQGTARQHKARKLSCPLQRQPPFPVT